MVFAEGVVAARTLGEARDVIDRLNLLNWVPASPTKTVKVRCNPNVLVVGDFDVPEPVLRSIRVASGVDDLFLARVDLL